ncbi:MAG TPA: PAS domain S-box protein [Methylomirabilota bacterium]|nr:PAS domain S-box protein [Methylomirabilota bacterium]
MDTSLFRRPGLTPSATGSLLHYGIAVGAAAIALALALALRPLLGPESFSAFILAAAILSWRTGIGPGCVPAVTGLLYGLYVLVDSEVAPGLRGRGVFLLGVYAVIASAAIWVLVRLRETHRNLRLKEAQLSAFLENSSLGLHWLDVDGRILWCNKAQLSLLGYAREEFVGQNITRFHGDEATARSLLRRTAANERLQNFEARLVAKDGSLKTVLLDSDISFIPGHPVHAHFYVRDITARREAEASRSRLARIVEATSDLVGIATPDGRLLYINRAGCQLLGVPEQSQLVGRPMSTLHPAWANRLLTETGLPTALRDGHWQGETALLTAEGREIPVSQVLLSSRNVEGEIEFISTIIRDISDRKAAEAAVQSSERKYRELVESATDLIWTLDLMGRCTFVNRAARHAYGYLPEELIGRHFTEFTAPQHLEKDREMFGRALQGEVIVNYETEHIRRDGRPLYLVCNARPVLDGQGNLVAVTGTATDITARKMAEDALRRSEASLRLAQRIGHVGSWEVDLPTGQVSWSDETRRILGMDGTAAPATAEAFFSRIHPNDRDMVRQAAREAIASGEWHGLDFRIQLPDGSERIVNQQALVIRDTTGRATQLVGTLQDITERKLAEEAIQKLNATLELRVARRTEQLEAANRDLEAFAYSVSHDLRAPLRAITGFIEILEENHASSFSAEARRLFSVIASSARRMDELIEDLLRLSRLGRQDLDRTLVKTREVVATVIEELAQQNLKHRLPRFEVGDLPSVFADASLLRQVFANLISNAVKFSRAVPEPRVEIQAETTPHEVIFSVRDNGVGFDMRYATKLFTVFQRLHKADEFEGTGVGLAIVHRIVTRHGGRVWVQSAPQQGAAFYFTLPRQDAPGPRPG